ncbi:BA14K family protein [Pararhizobium sp. IMCC21322]|uniref:BA14K family protein n=1 Tax=Pararhizobium sp. IMCC21322 TaxID=3067903 RepID=UPI0027413B4A|nr:BA14K family protein [Pararhizobium sp. IMCC21322]
MKRKNYLFSTFSSLLVAVFMIATYSSAASAHGSKYRQNYKGGIILGFGSHGVFGGVKTRGGKYGRRSHCHGRSYCHRHANRGYHNHNKRGVKTYPRHTAPRYYRSRRGSAHVNWCDNRYRSYDIYTDTFQPYKGGRKRCNSPFD